MTEVAAALIWNNAGNKFLICQRPKKKARGLLWEFPGGKVEPGETKKQALIRECQEELNVTLSVEKIFAEVVHEYADITVSLTLFVSRISEGTPEMLEHNALSWITPADIPKYDFCLADKTILEKIINEFGGIAEPLNKLQKELFKMQDLPYRSFNCRLMPNVDPSSVIGVRTPQLRAFAKNLFTTTNTEAFLKELPHRYYEENNLHGFMISLQKDYLSVITELDVFLPYVDNWATCDLMSPKVFKKHLPELLEKIKQWIKSEHTYTIRFGLEMLMSFYLDDDFRPDYLEIASSVRSEEYYVNMMTAWFFATALAKQYDFAVKYIENHSLDKWTHNKAIQKAVESYRITDSRKDYLRSLKIR